ncbi:MAG: hypothetical protein JNJ52_04420 [Flavobacterium sp.]|nr:hypothetical protein [Flavobacterium sp.]
MKKLCKIVGLFALLLSQFTFSQATPSVNVTVQVLPPYSTYLPDYLNSPNRVLFTLLSYSNANVRLRASITGDNGITVRTSESYIPPTALQLQANQQKMLTGLDLKNYLDINSVIVTGISKNDLYRGSSIPEGTYTFCLQVLDYTTGAELSNPEPLGCSNPFEIKQIAPPQLIAPRCDEPIVASNIQNVVFSWLPPQDAPVGSQYKLKIVELVPSTRNPNEALNSATTPAFFETTTNSFSFLYGPSQPQLRKGRKYAWRVTLLSGRGSVVASQATNLQNNGNSEVCSFDYVENQATTEVSNKGIQLINPIDRKKLNKNEALNWTWSASPNNRVKEYKVWVTRTINDKKEIREWKDVSENLFKYELNYTSYSAHSKTNLNAPSAITTVKGRYAWKVVGLDENQKVIDESEVEAFEIAVEDKPIGGTIQLINPIKAKQIPAGTSYAFEWTSSKNTAVEEYNLEGVYIENNDKVSNELFTNKSKNVMVLGPFKETSFNFKSNVDANNQKIAWRIVGLSNGKTVDVSPVETYEIVEDKSELANLKVLIINDYAIQITKIANKDQDSFSGSGKILLWEGGKEVLLNFSNLKVRPITYYPKIKTYQWAAIAGTVEIDTKGMFPNNRVDLQTQKESDGAFQLALNSIKLTANLEGAMDADNKLFKITKNNGTSEAKIKGKWFTNFFIYQNGASNSSEQYLFESANEGTVKISFKDKFDGTIALKSQKMQNLLNSGIEVEFSPTSGLGMTIKGLEAQSDLSGTIKVPNAKPSGNDYNSFGALEIPFKNQKNLNFKHKLDAPLKWKINEDGSVWANVSETYVHLSFEGALESQFESYNQGLNFDKFGIEVKLPAAKGAIKQATLNLAFDKIYNKGKGYTTNTKPGVETKNTADIAGFTSKLNKSSFMIKNNKLIFLNLNGDLFVPFVNDWASLMMTIDDKKIQEINLSFDYNKKYYLVKNQVGDSAYITVWAGRLENNAVVISPSLTINSAADKGLETNDMSMCELFISPNGTVSYDTNFTENTESVCEGTKRWATYYRFSYGIDQMKIKRNSVKTDATFLFNGDVVLGPNISSTSKKEMGFVFHGTEPKPNSVGYSFDENDNWNSTATASIQRYTNGVVARGPKVDENAYLINPLENGIEISDDGKSISGGYEDGAQKFGGGFGIKYNPTWGNYFELGGYYQTKEPEVKEITAKMILGKTTKDNGNYTYWFFEFKQKNFVTVPIVPGIIEANGFGGKTYFHIQPTYNNLGQITEMKPNKDYSLGIAAEADVRTTYDQGKTIHGHVQIVLQFKGWSIDGISYFIKADAVAEDGDSPGMLQARLNGQLNWVKKYIDGQGQVWGKIKDLVCINEGDANEDSIFFHFGADDFYLKIGTEQNPIVAEVMCGSGMTMGVWFALDTNHVEGGLEEKYDSGWKGLDLGIASGMGRLTTKFKAKVGLQYSPFKFSGSASFTGRAYGKGCVDLYFYSGCISGSCGASANLNVSMPNPTVFEGSVECDVHKYIPNFTLHARWSSSDGFDIWI